jgi:hypothetical protein
MRTAIVLVASVGLLTACGGSGGSSTPSGPFQVTLTAAGANPSTFNALSQADVQFKNTDTKAHQISSTSCPQMGTPSIAAGANATVTLPAGPMSCTFTDSPSGTSGSVSILAPGNGY